MLEVEGRVEDIDIHSPGMVKAIQCKYHEGQDYSLSTIYKPIFQFMVHSVGGGTRVDKYILYAHFRNGRSGGCAFGQEDLENVFRTDNFEYIKKYASRLVSGFSDAALAILKKGSPTKEDKALVRSEYSKLNKKLIIDTEDFLQRLRVEFSASLDELKSQAASMLVAEMQSVSADDVRDIFFPNAVQLVADISMISDARSRRVSKSQFLGRLNSIRVSAVSRWTNEIVGYKKSLIIKRKELVARLNLHRKRLIVFDPVSIGGLDGDFMDFVDRMVKRYVMRNARLSHPLFFVLKVDADSLQMFVNKCMEIGVDVETGYFGPRPVFNAVKFLEPPMKVKGGVEFHICCCGYEDFLSDLARFERAAFNDVYVVNLAERDQLCLVGVPTERLDVQSVKDLAYVFNLDGASK